MTQKTSVVLCAFVAMLWPSGRILAQQSTGLPPFGSFSGGPFDVVNNANLNVHVEFPVFSRAGRGLPFSYKLSHDTAVWRPATSGSSTVWTPATNWGWTSITQIQTGYITFASVPESCSVPGTTINWTNFVNFLYWDQVGANHSFPVAITNWQPGSPCGGGPNLPSGSANDGSGYTLTASVSGNSVSTTLTDRSGKNINAPQQQGTGAGGVTDTNGNLISVSSSGGTTKFFDTLSSTAPALTVTGAGTPSSPYNFAYTNPSGGTSSYTLNYTNYSVRTNFGCSGIVEYNSASQPLVSSISLPDGTAYTFTYESTPSFPGSVTGRLHSVTLPAGGTLTYTYSGGNNGITCADGSTATLTRTTPDGTWTYAHTESGTAWVTKTTDPSGNQSGRPAICYAAIARCFS